jgi:prevent-host-death family protein
MIRTWQLQEAKNKFSEVVDEAMKGGPQLITKRGMKAVILISYEDYRRLTVAGQPLSAFFRESPLTGAELDLRRDTSEARAEPTL